MRKSGFLLMMFLLIFVSFGFAQENNTPSSMVKRVGDTAFVRVEADSFKTLDVRQQELAYWLSQASIAIDPIIYQQFSSYGLRQKRLFEELVAHKDAIDASRRDKIVEFAELFWANRGNHSVETSQKFLPDFTFDELKSATLAAQKDGAFKTSYAELPPLTTAAELSKELEDLRPSLFDPQFEPMITAKSPQNGKDIIEASSNTLYGKGVTLADLKGFTGDYVLNSRVVKGKDGKLREEVYRAGTPDGKVAPGLYALYLKRANEYLAKAQSVADPAEAKVIGDLIRYYQTGERKDWIQFDTDWVQNDATVDFVNGFIEVYRDARGAKAASESFVSVTDKPVTDKMIKLAQNAAYFEEKAPWDAKYKRQDFKLPTVKAVETVIETGDFEVNTIGDNLPNENEIHEKYGSKNFLLTSSTRAFNNAVGHKSADEFSATPEIAERNKKYGDEAEDLLTAMHEVIGHGSGKLSDRVKGGAESYLKEYFSTLEEGRADLMAYWNVWDPKLKELGLISNQEEVGKAMYDMAANTALLQLRRIPKGDTIEEDHARDRQLIVNYIRDKVPGAITQFDRDGKTYVQVQDYQKMHEGVGMLLAELMRIKAEGDYDAIKALVNKYAVHFDPALRDQVIARYAKLDLPTYWAGINATFFFRYKGGNRANFDIGLIYPGVDEQYLNYGRMYDKGLIPNSAKQASH